MDDAPGRDEAPGSDDAPGIDEAAAWLRDSLYTVVGLGILGVQQAQVRRRDLQRDLARLADEVDERVDPVLDGIEARLSEDVRPLLVHARSAARSLRQSLVGPPPRRPQAVDDD